MSYLTAFGLVTFGAAAGFAICALLTVSKIVDMKEDYEETIKRLVTYKPFDLEA